MTHKQDKRFEKLGRYLDGENVELTPADRKLLDEFNRNEADVSARLDIELPQDVTRRVRRRMNAALLTSPRRRFVLKLVGVAGVAAAMVVGIGLFRANFGGDDRSKPEKSIPVVRASQDDSGIDESVVLEAVNEELAIQEEQQLLALLEPLYTEDTVEFWDENDEGDSFILNGT